MYTLEIMMVIFVELSDDEEGKSNQGNWRYDFRFLHTRRKYIYACIWTVNFSGIFLLSRQIYRTKGLISEDHNNLSARLRTIE